MLIDQEGNKEGIIPTKEAIKKAEASSLDLVQVTPNDSEPVVCKILDYGKYVFAKKKSTQSSNTKAKKTSLKEIKFKEFIQFLFYTFFSEIAKKNISIIAITNTIELTSHFI